MQMQPNQPRQPQQPQQPQRQQTMQREYKTKRAMQRGIQHEANHGWRVISTMDVPPGCLRKLLFGLIFARTHYLVTYEK